MEQTGFVFDKNWHRFRGNQPPILRKSVTDFGKICHRFWENPLQTLRKSATELGEIRHRFWEAPFLEKQALFFGTNWCGLVENWFGFWIGLGQSPSLTVLNAKHVRVWIFDVLGLGVSSMSQPVEG